jgi:endonuclease/exonuclease/phosphatase (EEP) superfamily protein YafD
VRHNTSSPATRGTAIAVRRSAASYVGKLRLVRATGSVTCKRLSNGRSGNIGTRYMALVDVRLSNGQKVNLISVHMPPKRCWGTTYDQMATKVVSEINSARKRPGRVIVGGDWNKVVRNNPNNIKGRTGLVPRGPAVDGTNQPGIDGFFVPKGLSVSGLRSLARHRSDHRAVQLTVTIT